MGLKVHHDIAWLKNKYNTSFVTESQIYYVGKHGSDSYDGKSIEKAFLTFGAAKTAADAQTPSSSNIFNIICLDAGVYAEGVNLASWTNILAPLATINGNIILSDNTFFECYAMNVSSGSAVSKASGTGTSFGKVKKIICTGAANGVLAATGSVLKFEGDYIEVATGGGVKSNGSSARLDATVEHIKATGAGYCLETASTGDIILCAGYLEASSGTGLAIAGSTTVNAIVGEISASVAYNNAGTLNLFVGTLSGTETNSGTANVTEAKDFPDHAADADAHVANLLTTQGDLLTRDGSVPKRLAKGTEGYFLRAGASEPEWAASTGVDESQIYYVGKHGNDSNDGKSVEQATLTFGAAKTLADAQTPSSSNIFNIICLDAGVYAESITLAAWTNIYAPLATINGNVTLADNTTFECYDMNVSSQAAIAKTTGTGHSLAKVKKIICSSTADGVNASGDSILKFEGNYIEVATGSCLSSASSSTRLDAEVEHLKATGAGYCLETSASGNVNLRAGYLEAASGTGLALAGGVVNAVVEKIAASTAYTNNGTINLFVGTLSGTETNNGTANVTKAGAGSGGKYGMNVESLSDNKTLTPGTDEIYQYLDPNGASRIITLATTGATAGDRFVIRNTAAYTVTYYFLIRTEGGGATNLDYVYAQGIKHFIFDGTDWIGEAIGTSGYNDVIRQIEIGHLAQATNDGVAIGKDSKASSQGVGVGFDAEGYTYGVGIGYSAYGDNKGVGVGHEAWTKSKEYTQCYGYYSWNVGERSAVTVISIDGLGDKNFYLQGRYAKTTANATPVEMFLGDIANERFTIIAQSALAFEIQVVARDDTAGHVAKYKFDGVIKRDAADNTVLSVVNKTIVWEDDSTWDVNVTADDVNEALKLEVTGDATNSTQWAAILEGMETIFT